MANEKQEIVLEIQVQGSIDNLAKLRSEMDSLIKTRQDLSAKSKEGDIEATKEIEKVNSAVRNMQTEYKAQQRVLDGYNASQKTNVNTSNLAANSIQQNRDLLKQLTAQYIQLKAPSANATSQIKHLSDVLKEQESAIGNNTRNVGNYKEALLGAAKELPLIGSGLGSIIDPLKGISNGFSAAGGGAAGFQAALLGGIPLILAGMQGIISVMQKFDSVTEGLEDTMNGVNLSFDYFVGHANDGSLTELIVNMGKAYDEGVKLSQVMRELAEAQDVQRLSNAQANKQIEALLLQSKDRTKDAKDRIALLDLASKKEEENLKQNVELAKQKVDLAQMELKRVIEAGLNDDKQKKNAIDAAVELINLERESGNLQEKIINRRNALLDEEKAKREKSDADAKKRLDTEQKRAELESSLYNKTQSEKLAALKKFDEERKKQEDQELKDIQAKYELENSFLQKQLAIDLGYADLEVASKEEKEKRKQQILINSLEKQLDLAIKNLGADGDITKVEIQGIEAIRLKLKQAKADAAKPTPETYFESLGINQEALGNAEKTLQGFAQIVSSINDIVTKGFQIRENEIESEKNHEIEAIQSSTLAQKEKDAKIREINKQAAKEKYQLELQAFNTSKGIQIVQAIISTALGVVNGLNAGLSLGPAGFVMGPVLAALAGVTGAVQIALIASQQPPPPPKFAQGVIGLDGEGTETSDSIDARLSKGESVMTAKATKKFHRELAYMEMSVGNTPNYKFGRGKFASGFIPSPNVVSSDGGFAARDIARNSDNSALIQQAIKNGFALAPAPVLSIVEFQSKQNSRNRSVNISEA